MRVHWTDTAQAHLAAIHAYIAQDSAEYANRTIDRLTRRSQQIADFPLSGRRVPEYDMDQVREVIETSYRIIYPWLISARGDSRTPTPIEYSSPPNN